MSKLSSRSKLVCIPLCKVSLFSHSHLSHITVYPFTNYSITLSVILLVINVFTRSLFHSFIHFIIHPCVQGFDSFDSFILTFAHTFFHLFVYSTLRVLAISVFQFSSPFPYKDQWWLLSKHAEEYFCRFESFSPSLDNSNPKTMLSFPPINTSCLLL